MINWTLNSINTTHMKTLKILFCYYYFGNYWVRCIENYTNYSFIKENICNTKSTQDQQDEHTWILKKGGIPQGVSCTLLNVSLSYIVKLITYIGWSKTEMNHPILLYFTILYRWNYVKKKKHFTGLYLITAKPSFLFFFLMKSKLENNNDPWIP